MITALTKTVTIDLDNVLPMLARAVEARGRDFVYLDHYDFCRYGEFQYPDTDEGDCTPACIVGMLVAQQGGDIAEATLRSGGVASLFGLDPLVAYRELNDSVGKYVRRFVDQARKEGRGLSGFNVTPEAAAVLSVAQGLQDQPEPKRSWGEAYDAAVLAHAELVLIRDAKALAAKAADEIEERGWRMGLLVSYGGDGCVCAVGGTGAAYFGDPGKGYGIADAHGSYEDSVENRRYYALLNEIADGLGLPRGHYGTAERIYRWNDDVAPTHVDPMTFVVGKLREYAGVTV